MNLDKSQARAELARRELARRKFIDFNRYVYDGYQEGWHIELLCEALEHVYKGDIRFLFVEMPPRHSKSVHVSQLFPAYVVGKDKDTPIIVTSYSGDLATDQGRETRNLIETQKYKNVFKTTLAPDSKAKGKWNTNGKGAYNAAGVGGSITGKGAKFFIVDDPFKDRKEADSALIREDRWRWLRSVARTRLTPDGRMIIMHTRWHQDDIIGRLTEHKEFKEDWVDFFDWKEGKCAKWVRLRLPAIAEVKEPHRNAGEALWPNRYPLSELIDIKSTLGPYEWSALYQQHPVDSVDRKFKQSWFKYRKLEEVMKLNTRKFLTIDPRGKDDVEEGNDYIGFCINFADKDKNWNIMAWREKVSSENLINRIFSLHDEWKFEAIGIEDTAFSQGLEVYFKQQMITRGVHLPVKKLKHGGTAKNLRIEQSLVPRYSNGVIYHLIGSNDDNLCIELEDELALFPKSPNDDTSDAVAYQDKIAQFPQSSVAQSSTPYVY